MCKGEKGLADLGKSWESLRSLGWDGQDREALYQRVHQKDNADSLRHMYNDAVVTWRKSSEEAVSESLPTLRRLNGEEYL